MTRPNHTATATTATLLAVTSAKRQAALEEFDRALGKYPGAAEYLDQQRAATVRGHAIKRLRCMHIPHQSGHDMTDRVAQVKALAALIEAKTERDRAQQVLDAAVQAAVACGCTNTDVAELAAVSRNAL